MNEARKRSTLLASINGYLADIEVATERVRETKAKHTKLLNDAKSEVGTAKAELSKLAGQYLAARSLLLGQMPDRVTIEESDHDRARAVGQK